MWDSKLCMCCDLLTWIYTYTYTGIAKETAYFQEHPKYRQMLSKCGTRNLARTLNQILMVHIKEVLPEIKTRISKMLVGVTTNLESLGDSLDDTNAATKGGIICYTNYFKYHSAPSLSSQYPYTVHHSPYCALYHIRHFAEDSVSVLGEFPQQGGGQGQQRAHHGDEGAVWRRKNFAHIQWNIW